MQPPVGYWDPAGLAKDGDAEAFKRRRSVELKHGRIAMLATMGRLAHRTYSYLNLLYRLYMVQRRWFPPPDQVWSMDLTPRAPLWWWKGAYLLSYLLNYLVT